MKLKISLNEERGDHSDRIASGWRVDDVEINNIEDAREIFCNNSYSPHEWVGGYRSKANHKETNFLVIDFDDGLTLEQAKERFHPYKNIIITSRIFSSILFIVSGFGFLILNISFPLIIGILLRQPFVIWPLIAFQHCGL